PKRFIFSGPPLLANQESRDMPSRPRSMYQRTMATSSAKMFSMVWFQESEIDPGGAKESRALRSFRARTPVSLFQPGLKFLSNQLRPADAIMGGRCLLRY